MHVRDPGFDASDLPSDASALSGDSDRPPTVAFAVPTGVVVGKFAVAALLALVALTATNPSQVLIVIAAAAGVTLYAARDVLARERLRAGPDGVVAVKGYSGRRRLAWSEIERMKVQASSRLGARSEMLELDTGGELFLYSRYDLGVDPDEALQALEVVREAADRGSEPDLDPDLRP